MLEVIRGVVDPAAVVPTAEVEVTVVRTTTVAAVTTDGTAPGIGTAAVEAIMIPGRPVTIPDGTRGKMTARAVATSGTIPIRIREIVVPRTVRDPVRIIPLREVAEITAAEAAAEIITVGMVVVQVVAVAHPAGTMMVAAHPTTNVAMNIIHRRLAAAVVAAAEALAVIGWITAAAAGDAVAVIDPGNRWDRPGRSSHEAPEAGDR